MRVPALLLSSLLACTTSGSRSLLVDVRTDLVPGVEMTSVEAELLAIPGSRQLLDATDRDWNRGRRVADFDELPASEDVVLEVRARRGEDVVLQRRTVVRVEGRTGVTIVLSRTCRDLDCPGAGDAPELTECLGGRCVPPECVEGDEEVCGDGRCASDDACPAAPSSCTSFRCELGVCLVLGDDAQCGTGQRCTPTGCVADEIPDAGPGDAGALDPDAGSAEQDAGGDAGPDAGVCGACDDGDPCTDDSCDGMVCVHDDNTAACDDGVFCNGPDQCAAGECVPGSSDPCAAGLYCDEDGGDCDECRATPDCPDEVRTLGACEYDDACAESGMRTVEVQTWSCVDGACVEAPTTVVEACSRATEGSPCGDGSTCLSGGCFCNDDRVCDADEYCYDDRRCEFVPILTVTDECVDVSVAGVPFGYDVYGRTYADFRKYNRHVSCGRPWSEYDDCGTISVAGRATVRDQYMSPASCDEFLLGRWRSYAEIDGRRSETVEVVYFHPGCPGASNCTEARDFCITGDYPASAVCNPV